MYLSLFTVTYCGMPHSLRAPNLSVDFHSPFDLVVDPGELHTGGIPPSLRSPDLSIDFHSSFDLVVDPCKLHTVAYPPSLGSSDFSQVSLSFNLVVDPYELSYWDISPFTKFVCIVILVILWI